MNKIVNFIENHKDSPLTIQAYTSLDGKIYIRVESHNPDWNPERDILVQEVPTAKKAAVMICAAKRYCRENGIKIFKIK